MFGDEVEFEIDSLQCNSWRSGCRMEQFQIPVSLSWIVFRSETDTLDLVFLGLTKRPTSAPQNKKVCHTEVCIEQPLYGVQKVASLSNIGT